MQFKLYHCNSYVSRADLTHVEMARNSLWFLHTYLLSQKAKNSKSDEIGVNKICKKMKYTLYTKYSGTENYYKEQANMWGQETTKI